ncbi:MAG: hypothetical protein GAK40_01366 [Burkholderia plantarii]|nr:MAG: hypothetical protein GAK40_01366 [Burkholderia plantarii]
MTDPSDGAIRVVPNAGSAGLSALQKRFNSLTRQIAARRARLDAWDAVWPAFQQRYVDEWVPLARDIAAREAELVHQLDIVSDMKGLTKAERTIVSALIASLARSQAGDEAAHALQEIYARHRGGASRPAAKAGDGTRAAKRRRAGRAEGGAESDGGTHGTSAASSVNDEPTQADVDIDAESPEAQMARIQAELDAAEAHAAAAAEAREAHRAGRRGASASRRAAGASADAGVAEGDAAHGGPGRDDAQEARQQDGESEPEPELTPAQINRALRDLYRRLASALHPDREPDPHERARKTEQMQHLNRAYDRQDLLSLLELERDLALAGADRLTGAGDELLRHYNTLLKAQLGSLDRQVQRIEADFRQGYGIGANAALAPDTALRTLAGDIGGLRQVLAGLEQHLRAFRDLDALRAWLAQFRG